MVNPHVIDNKFNTMIMYEFAQQFKNSFLREALSACFLPLDAKLYTVGVLIFKLSFYNRKDVCWSIWGSLAFSNRIANKYISLDGKINYNSKVDRIIIKDNKAIGIRISNGSEFYADYILSTIDGYFTIFNLLQGNYINDKIKLLFDSNRNLPTSIQVSLGINCDLSNESHNITLELNTPIVIGDITNTYLYFKHYCYNSTMASSGKSVIVFVIYSWAMDKSCWGHPNSLIKWKRFYNKNM